MNDRNLFHKIGDFFTDYGLEFGRFCTTTLIAVVSILLGIDFNKDWVIPALWVILIIVIAISFVIEYKVFKKSRKISQLEKDIEKQSSKVQLLEATIEKIECVNYDLFQYVLISLYNKLGFDGQDRISIYKKEKDRFVIMSRYSINPKLGAINRKHYPIYEGFIGQALQQGEYFVDNLPNTTTGNREKYYNAIMAKCDIDKEILRSITMKSRSFYCKALTDSTGRERNAIIVFESLAPRKLVQDDIMEAISTEERKLVAFVENVNLRIPETDTKFAQENGF